MSVSYDPKIFYNEAAVQAWITQYANDIAAALPPLSIATRWWAEYAYVAPKSAPLLKIPFNLTVPRMGTNRGRMNMQRGTTRWYELERTDPRDIGFVQDIERLRGGDFGMFAQHPSMIAHAIDIDADVRFAELLNAGYTTPDWTGKNFFVLSGAAANLQRPVNPGFAGLGTYTNARQNFAFTSDNVSTLIGDLNTRKGLDGRYLGNEEREAVLWIPPTMAEEAKQILERVEITFTSGSGGTARAFKRASYRIINDLRSDLWLATLKPRSPWELMFVHMLGANPNQEQSLSGMPSWQVMQGEDQTPHREIEIIDTTHVQYQMGKVVGYKAFVHETPHLLNGLMVAAAYTGSAS
jgi:hypothetical protein